jgi:hypothetical protein
MPSWQLRLATPADEEAVRTCMLAIIEETGAQKSPGFGKEFWDWQYRRGPRPALVLVADDGTSFRGYYHVLILDMRYRGRPVLGAIIQDIATLKAHRREGILRAMEFYGREWLARHDVAFMGGFPNDRSIGAYSGEFAYPLISRVPVYVCPLESGPLFAGRLGLGQAGRLLGRVVDPALRTLRMGLAAGETVEPLARFDAEVETVAREFAADLTVSLERSAQYLNWRFVAKPTHEYTTWVLRQGGEARAYVVTRAGELFGERCAIVMDFGCRRGAEAALLRLLSERMRATANTGLTAVVVAGHHPFLRRLRRLGFARVPDRMNPRRIHFVMRGIAPYIGPEFFL